MCAYYLKRKGELGKNTYADYALLILRKKRRAAGAFDD